jgi:hypothetical protein
MLSNVNGIIASGTYKTDALANRTTPMPNLVQFQACIETQMNTLFEVELVAEFDANKERSFI